MSNRVLMGVGVGCFTVVTGLSIIGYGLLRNSKEQTNVRELQRTYEAARDENAAAQYRHQMMVADFAKERESWKQEREVLSTKVSELTGALGKMTHDRDYLKQSMAGFQQEIENLAVRMKAVVEKDKVETPAIMRTAGEESADKKEPMPFPAELKKDDTGLEAPMGK